MKDYSATTGTAIADEGAWNTAGTFQHIALDRITPSLTNPRKTFDPAKLAELAASIRASGVHQAVLVRRLCRGCGHAANLSLIVCKHTKS
jgi:hypothetical protein